jgi:hypothetical protein
MPPGTLPPRLDPEIEASGLCGLKNASGDGDVPPREDVQACIAYNAEPRHRAASLPVDRALPSALAAGEADGRSEMSETGGDVDSLCGLLPRDGRESRGDGPQRFPVGPALLDLAVAETM